MYGIFSNYAISSVPQQNISNYYNKPFASLVSQIQQPQAQNLGQRLANALRNQPQPVYDESTLGGRIFQRLQDQPIQQATPGTLGEKMQNLLSNTTT